MIKQIIYGLIACLLLSQIILIILYNYINLSMMIVGSPSIFLMICIILFKYFDHLYNEREF
jgi:hypothetical protein